MRKPPSNLRCALMPYHPLKLACDCVARAEDKLLAMSRWPTPEDLASVAVASLQDHYSCVVKLYKDFGVLDDALADPIERPPHLGMALAVSIAERLSLKDGGPNGKLMAGRNKYIVTMASALADRAATILGWSEETPKP